MDETHVLVPIDGSPLSEAILPLVCAGLDPRTVTLVRVIEPPGPVDAGLLLPAPAAEPDVARDLERLAGRLQHDFGLRDLRTHVGRGTPAARILEAATACGADLIALTTHGWSGFDRLVLGGVAERVIRAAPVPVLALRVEEEARRPPVPAPALFERVIVPFDGSALAWRAVDGLARFDRARRARVTLVGVIDLPQGEVSPRTRALVAELLEVERPRVRAALEQAAARVAALGFGAGLEVEVGGPAAKILDRAAALEATLIAIATHGRSGPARWLLGSVTEKVLRAATVPLLICR